MPRFIYRLILALYLSFVSSQLWAAPIRQEITFYAKDSVPITADLYFKGNEYPYVLLFHQEGNSRAEFHEIAKSVMNLNYNCLAVDLRSGGKLNYVENKTARFVKQKKIPTTYLDSEKDILAAIDFAFKKKREPVILLGSSFSASLCLKVAVGNHRVKAVVAFSPGEYFKPDYIVKEHIGQIQKPIFVTANDFEKYYVADMLIDVDPQFLTLFTPENGQGERGTKALWKTSANKSEYWMGMLMFFSKFKPIE